ncbi:hypothetical protein [Cognatilysobacter segetis]|uniref:hypothetical protein n=1 Tax=Cognatilysobacter segetis TaxID=2492394 RepID=UPI00105EE257|nr:hypothetical protein [Lysobacter segetis]
MIPIERETNPTITLPTPSEQVSTMDQPSYRAWHTMTAREQAVWSAAFAQACVAGDSPLESAARAEAAVFALRGTGMDAHVAGPETELARLGIELRYDEFVPWYRVAMQLERAGSGRAVADELECRQAFERYERGRTDFY